MVLFGVLCFCLSWVPATWRISLAMISLCIPPQLPDFFNLLYERRGGACVRSDFAVVKKPTTYSREDKPGHHVDRTSKTNKEDKCDREESKKKSLAARNTKLMRSLIGKLQLLADLSNSSSLVLSLHVVCMYPWLKHSLTIASAKYKYLFYRQCGCNRQLAAMHLSLPHNCVTYNLCNSVKAKWCTDSCTYKERNTPRCIQKYSYWAGNFPVSYDITAFKIWDLYSLHKNVCSISRKKWSPMIHMTFLFVFLTESFTGLRWLPSQHYSSVYRTFYI